MISSEKKTLSYTKNIIYLIFLQNLGRRINIHEINTVTLPAVLNTAEIIGKLAKNWKQKEK